MVSRKTEQLKLKSYLPGFQYIAKIIVYVILFFFRLLGDFSLDWRTLAKLHAKSVTFFWLWTQKNWTWKIICQSSLTSAEKDKELKIADKKLLTNNKMLKSDAQNHLLYWLGSKFWKCHELLSIILSLFFRLDAVYQDTKTKAG